MSGPADFKSAPGFENQPRFVGVIEQNKISQTFFHYCITMVTGGINVQGGQTLEKLDCIVTSKQTIIILFQFSRRMTSNSCI